MERVSTISSSIRSNCLVQHPIMPLAMTLGDHRKKHDNMEGSTGILPNESST
jgi:hypothetical protein